MVTTGQQMRPRPVGRVCWLLALHLLAPAAAAGQSDTLHPGTRLPVRFVQGVRSGRDSIGSIILLQTMASVTRDSCVMLAPYRTVWARVSTSKGGRMFGRGGQFGLSTDSLRRLTGEILLVEAILDTLEWERSGARLLPSGVVEQHGRSAVSAAILPAVAATGGLAIVPVALIGGWSLLHKGAGVEILAGELAGVRLVEPFAIATPASCQPLTGDHTTLARPQLPDISPRATDPSGLVLGDQFNVVLLGTEEDVRQAFRAAGWTSEVVRSLSNIVRGSAAVVFKRQDQRVPFSPEFYQGRVQDLGFQRIGLNARERHHVRLWRLDTDTTVWVGAANEDVGFKVAPFRLSATHRMDPDIDHERDILTGDLEAGGCAKLLGLVALPGAVTSGHNTSRQAFTSDGRASVLRAGCGGAAGVPR
jgi:hypothetical protein